MTKSKKTRRFAQAKKLLSPNDSRLKTKEDETARRSAARNAEAARLAAIRHIETPSAAQFFSYNTALGPPYHILLDANFINFALQNKIDLNAGAMDCLYAKCNLLVPECVLAELEKLGPKYKLALRSAKDPRIQRLVCQHRGTYADDCLVERVKASPIYIVATCDKDLKRRLRKVPGVPIMYIQQKKFTIERLPEAYGAPK